MRRNGIFLIFTSLAGSSQKGRRDNRFGITLESAALIITSTCSLALHPFENEDDDAHAATTLKASRNGREDRVSDA